MVDFNDFARVSTALRQRVDVEGKTAPQGGIAPAESQATGRVQRETVVVIDFGSQYSMLIARRVRESSVYCEIIPHTADWESVSRAESEEGIILSGGPASVYEPDAPLAPDWVYESGLPVLGICYGMQAMAHQLGGKVAPSSRREYGHAVMDRGSDSEPLFKGLPQSMPVWMSHGDQITVTPPGFKSLARSENSPVVVMGQRALACSACSSTRRSFTRRKARIVIENFLYEICGCDALWDPR